jgi:hypothetical protein
MLEASSLLLIGRSAQFLQAAVDLDRVAVDSHRVLASTPQRLCNSDGDARLADRRRTEQRQNLHRPLRGAPPTRRG